LLLIELCPVHAYQRKSLAPSATSELCQKLAHAAQRSDCYFGTDGMADEVIDNEPRIAAFHISEAVARRQVLGLSAAILGGKEVLRAAGVAKDYGSTNRINREILLALFRDRTI